MFECEDCKRTFSRRSSLNNHIKKHVADHIDEQMRITIEELKKNNEQEVRYSPVRYSPIVEDIIDDIIDVEEEYYDEAPDDEILGADIISDDKPDEVNNLFYLSFIILYYY
jgi:hypothetical protein